MVDLDVLEVERTGNYFLKTCEHLKKKFIFSIGISIKASLVLLDVAVHRQVVAWIMM